jgi:hypothetical protein
MLAVSGECLDSFVVVLAVLGSFATLRMTGFGLALRLAGFHRISPFRARLEITGVIFRVYFSFRMEMGTSYHREYAQ